MLSSIPPLEAVSQTLMLPLYFRAQECQAANPLVHDPMALDLVEQLPYNFRRLEGHTLMKVATLLRVAAVDRMVGDFLAVHPDAVVVNVGAGLDTRFFRMDTGKLDWYEMDLPEVMQIRRCFFRETERYHMMDASLDDPEWCQRIQHSGRPLLIIAEGVLMYLSEACVRGFVHSIRKTFGSSFLIFDAVSPYQVMMSAFNPTLWVTGARFRWGLSLPGELEGWMPDIRLCESCYYLSQPEPRLGWLNVLCSYPAVRFGFSVLAYALGAPGTASSPSTLSP
ncbi:class I SAM-dependent methyltransferase [Desulfobotulus sp.]|jgi:O-methyltransferase involved in polyketide biosynthesis|uniref:class I SAM-dependent methyltransferase n=1 Tax=Desulfobotulus sp. TaxID=1940337 RepID=UPI002A35B60A|nr:class I SAM-dependent methyltransferase [Desulfobotulus sp.]MDY0163221.1 class I SAM-dependent methyltransferase [Desulfobotulus sp.]